MDIKKIFYWSITAALAGFLFGFDTAVISGAEQAVQKLWNMNNVVHGLAISMALWGTVIGAIFGGIPCDRYGRKKTLIWIGVLYLVSALGSAMAVDPYSFMFFRFIGGLGVGASSVAGPTYISEIAPAKHRGRLVALYQFNIVLGILVAYISNYLLGNTGANGWRWMLGVEAVPALIYAIMVMGVPNSPRWLILRRNDLVKAKEVLLSINVPDIDKAIQSIQKTGFSPGKSEGFFSGKYSFPILLAFLLAAFNQLSGINFVIYYSPRIFEAAGIDASNALLSTAGIGVINLIFTLLGMYLIDKSGRKLLMYLGSIGYIVSLVLTSRAFYLEDFSGFSVPVFLFIFIASHAIGQGAVIWVFISEIFPNKVRANGQALGSSTHWVFAAIITLLMPYVLGKFDGGPIFAFFAFMMFLQLIFVWRLMPETKGVSLEEIEKKLIK